MNPEVIAAGELLIDMISTDFSDNMKNARQYESLAGGSPANLAGNLARLGKKVGLVATVGKDGMGNYLSSFVTDLELDTTGLRQVDEPTTLILVTRSQDIPGFEAYRSADCQIYHEQFPTNWQGIRLFHTTCFALSRNPARTNILMAADAAAQAGVQLSIDANYASKIWPDQAEAQTVVAAYCSKGAMIKVSEVDWARLYGTPWKTPEAAIRHFHQLGARIVCLTMGEKGSVVSDSKTVFSLGSRPVNVVDVTGAGDAFWSGFLSAWLDGYPMVKCALAARSMAEYKLSYLGPLPKKIALKKIYVDLHEE